MTLEELRKEVPELENYLKYMPKELEQRYWIKTYAPGVIIHQKDYELEYFGIIARGEHRVINEFQNGNVFMIEKNEPIDFVGEVTILPITAARGFFDLSAARLYLKAGGADGH